MSQVVKITPQRTSAGPFDATSNQPRVADWERAEYSPNAVQDHGDVARARAQEGIRNNPWLARALNLLVSHAIGCGMQPKPKLPDKALRADVLALWRVWASQVDADGVHDFYGLQGMIDRARRESGECFVRKLFRKTTDDLAVPLQIRVMESAMVPIRHNSQNGGNTIRQGIEIAPNGKRLAYWCYKQHPGERFYYVQDDLQRVPATDLLHHYAPDRPGQLRGIPTAITSLVRSRNFDQYESAELTRKKVRAKFVGSLTRNADDHAFDSLPLANQNPDSQNEAIKNELALREKQRSYVDLEDGYMLLVAPGETLNLHSGDAGNAGVDFLAMQLRAIAAGWGVPYELMTGDYSNTNDRIMRVILNVFYRSLEIAQDLLVQQVLQPIWNAWLDLAVMNLSPTQLATYLKNRKEWQQCEWRAHAWSYVNPYQEAQTKKILKDEGFTSRGAIVAESGWDVEEIDRQNQEDQQRERNMGLRYGAPAKSTASALAEGLIT